MFAGILSCTQGCVTGDCVQAGEGVLLGLASAAKLFSRWKQIDKRRMHISKGSELGTYSEANS